MKIHFTEHELRLIKRQMEKAKSTITISTTGPLTLCGHDTATDIIEKIDRLIDALPANQQEQPPAGVGVI